jgi:hypothetical protein
MTVIGLADQLHSASAIAKAGEREINEARRRVLTIVEAAGEAGFTLGEDFSVTDPNFYDRLTAAARQAHAEAIATSLRAAVGTLVAADIRVAGDLMSSAPGLGSNIFPEEDDPTPGSVGETIQLVNSHKKDGGPSPSPAPPPPPTPSPSHTDSTVAIDERDLEVLGKQGDVIEKSSEQAKKHATGRAAEAFDHSQGFGKLLGRLSVVAELWSGGKEFAAELEEGKSVKDAFVDVAPKTLGGIAGSWGGTTLGAAGGAMAGALGRDLPDVPFLDGSGKALVGVAGAGTGALIVGNVGGDAGKAAGEAVSEFLRETLD